MIGLIEAHICIVSQNDMSPSQELRPLILLESAPEVKHEHDLCSNCSEYRLNDLDDWFDCIQVLITKNTFWTNRIRYRTSCIVCAE